MEKDKYSSQELHYDLATNSQKLKRVWRSIKIWGLQRTIAKIINRFSLPIRPVISMFPRKKDFLLVGCGQFGLSTASFFISKKLGNRFLGCYDINESQALRAQKTYGYSHVTTSFDDLLALEGAKYIFIASNHASHAPQSIAAIEKDLTVHVEKPIAVNWKQLANLVKALKNKENKIFVGYNRPFAKATKLIRENLSDKDAPLTIQSFVVGHAINHDHWYYDPEEGTRICGNIGHWIDLSVHLLSQSNIPDYWDINVAYGDIKNREENISISMTSNRGDLVMITFSVRGEPFDGVTETINIQHDNLMVKIDDYQSMKLWKEDFYRNYKFWPKDVGHSNSVTQMFSKNNEYKRPWKEVLYSTILMLQITDMVKEKTTHSKFSFLQAEKKLKF